MRVSRIGPTSFSRQLDSAIRLENDMCASCLGVRSGGETQGWSRKITTYDQDNHVALLSRVIVHAEVDDPEIH